MLTVERREDLRNHKLINLNFPQKFASLKFQTVDVIFSPLIGMFYVCIMAQYQIQRCTYGAYNLQPLEIPINRLASEFMRNKTPLFIILKLFSATIKPSITAPDLLRPDLPHLQTLPQFAETVLPPQSMNA